MREKNNTNLERMRELIERLTEADIAYYKNDAPIMTDLEYDRLTEELASLEHDTGLVLSGSTALDMLAASLADPAAVKLDNAFNAPFEHRTGYEWLSRDEAEVDKYVADPACGFGLNPAGTRGMIEGAMLTGDADRLTNVRSDLPILIVSGNQDPLAAGGELIRLLETRYRAAGVHEVEVILYPEARHEILNETNRDEVTADIIAFLDRTVGA